MPAIWKMIYVWIDPLLPFVIASGTAVQRLSLAIGTRDLVDCAEFCSRSSDRDEAALAATYGTAWVLPLFSSRRKCAVLSILFFLRLVPVMLLL